MRVIGLGIWHWGHEAGTSDASGCKCFFLLADSWLTPFQWLGSPGNRARASVLLEGGGRAGRRESRSGCGHELPCPALDLSV